MLRFNRLLKTINKNYIRFNSNLLLKSPIIQLNGINYDLNNITSTDLKIFSEVPTTSQEFDHIYNATKIMFMGNQFPSLQTETYGNIMKIYENAEDHERGMVLMQKALDNPLDCCDNTVEETIKTACKQGIYTLREAIKIFNENNKIINANASKEIFNLLEKFGDNDDYKMIYDMYLEHKIILTPAEMALYIPYFTEEHDLVHLKILAKYFSKGYPNLHLVLAKAFEQLEDYESCLNELKAYFFTYADVLKFHKNDDYILKSVDLALQCNDHDLLGLLSDIILRSPNCPEDVAKKILDGWSITMGNLNKAKELQKKYPTFEKLTIAVPPPPPKRR